jgi:hypothetical protein
VVVLANSIFEVFRGFRVTVLIKRNEVHDFASLLIGDGLSERVVIGDGSSSLLIGSPLLEVRSLWNAASRD